MPQPKNEMSLSRTMYRFKGLISQSLSVIPPCSQHMSSDAALPASEPQLWTAPVVGLGDLAARCRSKLAIWYSIPLSQSERPEGESYQGLYISSSWVPIISLSNIYDPWHPGPLHIIILSSHNLSFYFLPSLASRAFTYHHPEFPEFLYLIFMIPGIQGLNISSSWVPIIYLFFTIPGIQGLYISSSWVPRISISNIYDPWHPGP